MGNAKGLSVHQGAEGPSRRPEVQHVPCESVSGGPKSLQWKPGVDIQGESKHWSFSLENSSDPSSFVSLLYHFPWGASSTPRTMPNQSSWVLFTQVDAINQPSHLPYCKASPSQLIHSSVFKSY